MLLKAKCGRRNFKFENFKFEMRCKGSREMRREWRTLRVVWDPALSQWANLCRAPTKKTGRRNRAYGAGFEGAKAKAHRQECVKFQDILYTALSGHPLHSRDGVTQRSTAVEHSLCGSSSRTRLRQ